jgi:lariat debranching enzyme
MLTFLCITGGVICVSITIVLLAISYWKYGVMKFARWLGFVAMIMFCNAAVIFPTGFDMDQIGGEPYQLPSSYQVGISYIFFVLALWITVISELFAGKVCLPHF